TARAFRSLPVAKGFVAQRAATSSAVRLCFANASNTPTLVALATIWASHMAFAVSRRGMGTLPNAIPIRSVRPSGTDPILAIRPPSVQQPPIGDLHPDH